MRCACVWERQRGREIGSEELSLCVCKYTFTPSILHSFDARTKVQNIGDSSLLVSQTVFPRLTQRILTSVTFRIIELLIIEIQYEHKHVGLNVYKLQNEQLSTGPTHLFHFS